METGDAPACFTKTLWEKREENPEALSEREIAYATGSLFGAGSDTSSSTLTSFILAMTCFPRVAAKAQEELDRVVGHDRSPTWCDAPNLPYCSAIIKETLRWRPVAVMGGTPHASIIDDHYNGHFIPKGTTILGNLWAIHHNEKYFKDSHDFIPERYLSPCEDGTLPYPHRDGHSAFGWVSRSDPLQCAYCFVLMLIYICFAGSTYLPRTETCRKFSFYHNHSYSMGVQYIKGPGSNHRKRDSS